MTTKVEGTCRINAVAVREISGESFGPDKLILDGKYALLNEGRLLSVGPGHRNRWSEETMKRFRDLLASMEADICGDLFEPSDTTGGGDMSASPPEDAIPSL